MTTSCLVTQRLGVYASDGPDDDSQPDWVPISGKVRFVPNVRAGDSFTVTDINGEKTVPAVNYVAEIRAGTLYHNDEVGIRLFAAGPNSNPKKITYKAQYFGLTANDVPITLRDVVFEAIPGGEIDLTTVTPVAGTPAMGITRGEPGHSPYVGSNGNWWIGEVDTGVSAYIAEEEVQEILSRADMSDQKASTALSKSATTEVKVDNIDARMVGIEAMTGLSPESPVDGQTANLLTQPETLTHAAAKSFTDPIVCSLQPTPLTSVHTSTVGDIYPLEVFDGYMWGFTPGGRIFRQPASGGQWSHYADGPVSGNIMRILPTGDGEVIVASLTQVHKSTGWATGSPTWELKITATGPTNILRSGIAGTGNKFIVTTYAGTSTEDYPHSRYAWISLDAGDTWTIRYDAYELHGEAGNQSHIHAVEYDQWLDRFYVSEGHSHGGDIAGIYASEDDGLTWVRAEGMRQDPAPVTVTATNGGLVCGSDNINNGLYGVQAAPIPDQALDWVWEWRAGALGIHGFARHAFREPTTGLVYVSFRSNHRGVAPIIAAGSPTTGGLVYEFQRSSATTEDRIDAVVVPTPNRLHAWAVSGSPATFTHITGRLGHPVARAVHDPGNVLGGAANINDSLALGPQSTTGQYLRSIVVGIGASLPDTLGQHQTVVGTNASATGNSGVTIGYAARGVDSTIVIGDGVVADFIGTVMIGRGATNTGGGQSVVVGRNANARAFSTVIGDNAKSTATSSKNVIVGQAATAHTESIAIGQGAQASMSTRSVVIGTGAAFPTSEGSQQHILIGNAAYATGSDGVTIGYQAVGSTSSVAIGKGVVAPFAGVVVIGTGSVVEGGGSAVAIGLNSYARSQSVAIGATAKVTTDAIRATAIGYGASAASESVALGANTLAPTPNVVAIGPRALLVQDRASAPTASPSGGQLYARDGELYWLSSGGVSTKIAPIT